MTSTIVWDPMNPRPPVTSKFLIVDIDMKTVCSKDNNILLLMVVLYKVAHRKIKQKRLDSWSCLSDSKGIKLPYH
jgi:hypothetical protein